MKWHLPSSSSAEHRGRTDKAQIREHRAAWDYNKNIPVRMTIDKNQSLQPCEVLFEIVQDYNDGGRGGRVHLGNVKLNLAEYTNPSEIAQDPMDPDEVTITRRYLMQDSKVNATLKIGISMKQIDGDTNYIAPALRSAMVIGGIAGIMSGDAGSNEDMPSAASKSKDFSEAQDIYRRTLAASWACERGEMPPDKLIEDLFAGGDGGKMNAPPALRRLGNVFGAESRDESSNSSDADSRRGNIKDFLTPDMSRSNHKRGGSGHHPTSSQTSVASGVSGRGSIEQQMQHSHSTYHGHGHSHGHSHGRRKVGEVREITEFDLRDDLRSWTIQS